MERTANGASDRFGRRASRTTLQPPTWLLPALGAVGLGLVVGISVVVTSPLYLIAGLIGLACMVAIFTDVRYGLLGFIAVVTLMPFVVVPVSVGIVKLTLVDTCLTAVLLVWLFRLLANRQYALIGSGIDIPVLLFVGICLTSFVLGTAYLTTAADARLFAKLLNSIVFFFSVVNCVRDVPTLRRLVLALAIGGAVASAIAIVLYFLPADTATHLLASLAHVGYPDSNILQYDANSHVLKAIGTSIDHNILGATLMICGTLTVGLLLLPGSPTRWFGLAAALGVTLVGLLLTYSRGSLVGFLIGCAVIAALRYRRLWLIGALVLVAAPFVPQLAQSSFVTHLEVGIAIQDQATQMRLGEYKDAFHLISEYPWFGVGFGSAPDVDLYVGVSSIYLLLAENTGLIGLAVWLWAIGSIVLRTIRRVAIPDPHVDPASEPAQAGTLAVACLGALTSCLVAGLFDHHFVDLNFPHDVALFWLLAGLLSVGVRLSASTPIRDPIVPAKPQSIPSSLETHTNAGFNPG